MPTIFISYRRSDSQDVTGRIYDRLVARFTHKQVFKDVDNIPLGVSFPLHIQRMLGRASAVLVIIGPNWVSARDEQGTRRLEDPNDFVRLEVETALGSRMPVIPVLVSGAQMPPASALPPSMQGMVSRNGIPVRPDPDFNHDIGRLISGLEQLEKLLQAKSAKGDKEVIPGILVNDENVVAGAVSTVVSSGKKKGPVHSASPVSQSHDRLPKAVAVPVAPSASAETEAPPRPSQRKLWPWLVGGILALMLVIGLVLALLGGKAGGNDKLDPNAQATFGEVRLKAGFDPDPFTKELVAGGRVNTNLGGVNAWVSKTPDFKLFYEAGNYVLTIHVESAEDTTLLINPPDGRWIANDDGPKNGVNPLLRFEPPRSGRYDIWVGTAKSGTTPKAKLLITEQKVIR